jgi:hypothetical protein
MSIENDGSRDPADPGPIGTASMDAPPGPPSTLLSRLSRVLRRDHEGEPAATPQVTEEDQRDDDPGQIGTIPSA